MYNLQPTQSLEIGFNELVFVTSDLGILPKKKSSTKTNGLFGLFEHSKLSLIILNKYSNINFLLNVKICMPCQTHGNTCTKTASSMHNP